MAVVDVERVGAVRTIRLNRPEKRNALDPEMIQTITRAFLKEPHADERVAVIRAVGPSFCAGVDLRSRDASASGARHIEALLHAVEMYPLPVVAVVAGDAIAGGNELALHCDFVVASETARFGMSLCQIGMAPSWFLTKKLLESAGPVVARTMLLLGDPMPARELERLGVIAFVAPPESLDDLAGTVIARLAANAPLAMKATKAVLLREMAFRDDIPHDDITKLVGEARTSADAREGMAARLEKRRPVFRGE